MFGDVCLGLSAARFTPGCHIAGFQPSTSDRVRVGRVSGGGGRAEAPPNGDRRRVGCLAPRDPRPRLQRRVVTRAIPSGPRARNMKAWAAASLTSGGPGNRANQFFRGLNGRNNTPASFTLNVPPLQGEEICLGTLAWGCARRASPQAVTWRAFSPGHRSWLMKAQVEFDTSPLILSLIEAERRASPPSIERFFKLARSGFRLTAGRRAASDPRIAPSTPPGRHRGSGPAGSGGPSRPGQRPVPATQAIPGRAGR